MVVGARGNLGSELCRHAQHEILPVGREDWAKLRPNDIANVDVVIHVASDLVSSIATAPSAILQSEMMVTARVLELMQTYSLPRLMYVSSCAVYGNASNAEESAPCHPVTINGQLKLLNERIVESFCGAHGIQWEVYRVFNMFGGQDRFSIVSRILSAVEKGTPVTVFNAGASVRDFVHVGDVARLLLMLLENRPPFSVLNVGTGTGTKIADLIRVAASVVPNFKTSHGERPYETAHSAANIGRLTACTGKHEFVSVIPFLETSLRTAGHTVSPAPSGS
jgi:UDP-glucose 4-epimerase